MRIIFAGTPEFAVPCLEAIIRSSSNLIAVYTQPDRPSGRGQALHASAVKQKAMEHSIPVLQPLNFKTPEAIEKLKELKPDIMVVIAYGLILPKAILEIPTYGCINVHASLLPRWRGAAPIQHAILHGDNETGISIMQMDAGMDTGNILQKAAISIEAQETCQSLHDRLSMLAPEPLLEILNLISSGQVVVSTPQETMGVTYAPKINKSDFLINWSQSAVAIERQVRAFYPHAQTLVSDLAIRIQKVQILNKESTHTPGTILTINKNGIEVSTGTDCLLIESIQFPGKKSVQVHEWIHGNQDPLFCGLILQ